MTVLIAIALKSLLVAGIALGLLALMKHRSAAERSWVAHIGLLALVALAVAPLVLPNWSVEAPALLGSLPEQTAQAAPGAPAATSAGSTATAIPAPRATASAALSPAALATALYALPAAILLLVTFLALLRLVALRARADVLVDGHWLSALARAQRRMGFKHGTALLTSDELASPISWGMMRPVILLNSRAVEAAGEAEAIIAHELAHVARMDWVKLLLARVATALFWFNPLVWMLAREAHQLREEAADDAVLAADIADTEYAQLLVGVARHECPGLLLGAHGVAPSRSSLARRVARVLDGKTARGPIARSFAFGVLVGAALVATPLAALTLTPKDAASDRNADAGRFDGAKRSSLAAEIPSDLPRIIARGVSTAVAAVSRDEADARLDAAEAARDRADAIREAAVAKAELAADAARERTEAVRAHGASRADTAAALAAVGATPQYVAAMRQAAPQFARLEAAEFVGLRAVGVTPEYARDLAAAGFRNIAMEDLLAARAVGVTGDYVRALKAAGVRAGIDEFIQLRAVGVDAAFVKRARSAGYGVSDADELVELKALGQVAPPAQPKPAAPPGGWGGTPPPGSPDDG